MKLYLTRHGKTEWNVERRMQGWQDSPLTQAGINNARALKERLSKIDFAEVYSSSVGRAYNTAHIVTGLNIENIVLSDNFREINLGSWEGRNIEDIKLTDEEMLNNFWNAPHLYKRETTESFYDVQKRAMKIVNDIIKKYKHTDKNVLIVTHTVTLKSIMAYFEGRSIDKLWDLPYIYDTSLSLIEINEEEHNIILHGDTEHIDNAVWEY